MKKFLFYALALAMPIFSACSEDDPEPQTVVSFSYSMPAEHSSDAIKTSTLELTDLATNVKTSYDFSQVVNHEVSLTDGLYDMTLVVTTTHTVGGKEVSETFRDSKQNVSVVDGAMSVSFSVVRVSGGQGFVLADMCLVSKLADGLKSYTGDGWFRIYNNSADTLFADGLCLVESAFNASSAGKHDYTPDIMAEAMTVQAVYQIPGSGKNVPVLPGASLLIADIAKDHTTSNALSFDLSKADFEWYDETEKNLDTDTEVPNLTCVYKLSKTIWLPSQRYNRSYAIGFLGGEFGKMTAEEFIENQVYETSYVTMVNEQEKTMTFSYYRFENSWILDAVSFAPSKDHAWNIIDQSLDAGYVSMGETVTDNNRCGKSARRKFANGMMVDSNNSSDDFEVVDSADPYYVFE